MVQRATPVRRALKRPSRPLRGRLRTRWEIENNKETPARRFPRLHIRIQARAFMQSVLPAKRATQGAGIIPQAALLFAACVSARDLGHSPLARSPTRAGGPAGTPGLATARRAAARSQAPERASGPDGHSAVSAESPRQEADLDGYEPAHLLAVRGGRAQAAHREHENTGELLGRSVDARGERSGI